jgi:hypothetical protein
MYETLIVLIALMLLSAFLLSSFLKEWLPRLRH